MKRKGNERKDTELSGHQISIKYPSCNSKVTIQNQTSIQQSFPPYTYLHIVSNNVSISIYLCIYLLNIYLLLLGESHPPSLYKGIKQRHKSLGSSLTPFESHAVSVTPVKWCHGMESLLCCCLYAPLLAGVEESPQCRRSLLLHYWRVRLWLALSLAHQMRTPPMKTRGESAIYLRRNGRTFLEEKTICRVDVRPDSDAWWNDGCEEMRDGMRDGMRINALASVAMRWATAVFLVIHLYIAVFWFPLIFSQISLWHSSIGRFNAARKKTLEMKVMAGFRTISLSAYYSLFSLSLSSVWCLLPRSETNPYRLCTRTKKEMGQRQFTFYISIQSSSL